MEKKETLIEVLQEKEEYKDSTAFVAAVKGEETTGIMIQGSIEDIVNTTIRLFINVAQSLEADNKGCGRALALTLVDKMLEEGIIDSRELFIPMMLHKETK